MKVYPNPSNGIFNLQLSVVSSKWSVEVYNILGEKVYSSFIIHNSPFTINLSNQPAGIYLYRVLTQSGELVGSGKLIIEK